MVTYPTTKATRVATKVLGKPGEAANDTSLSWDKPEARTAGMAKRNAYRVATSRR
jgi:hypothetical protein